MLSGATSDADLFCVSEIRFGLLRPGRTASVLEKLLPYIVPVKNKTQYIVSHPQTFENMPQTSLFSVFYGC